MGNLLRSKNNLKREPEFFNSKSSVNLEISTDDTPQQAIELFVSLRDVDFFSNFYCEVQIEYANETKNSNDSYFLGRSQNKSAESKNIDFDSSFIFHYYFEKEQKLWINLFKNGSKSPISIPVIVGKLMGSKGQLLAVDLKDFNNNGKLILKAVPVQKTNFLVNLKVYFKGTSYCEPCFFLKKKISNDPNFGLFNVFKSEILPNSKEELYNFMNVEIDTSQLISSNGDEFIIELYDIYYSSIIGRASVNLSKFNTSYSNEVTLNLLDLHNQETKNEIKLVGKLTQKYYFLDYLKGGLQIALNIGIDFTSSNGEPNNPNSLHYLSAETNPNAYERALKSCGEILAYYDYDQLFPVFGYGARLDQFSQVNHCFHLNFNDDPNIHTIDGIVKAYRNAIRRVKLYGPTNFAPLLRKTIELCEISKNDYIYTILLILTDGIINDMEDTIDALVDASFLPISIIIVGIGSADFSNMDVLDADDNPLYNRIGIKAARDLVQFVPFSKYMNNGELLARQVLEEVPRQIEDYFRMVKQTPRDPIIVQ